MNYQTALKEVKQALKNGAIKRYFEVKGTIFIETDQGVSIFYQSIFTHTHGYSEELF